MSRRAGVLAALVAAAGLLVLLVWLVSRDDGRRAPSPRAAPRAHDATASLPGNAANPREQGEAACAALPPAPLPPAPLRAAEPLAAAGELASVRGRVTDRDGAPLEGARVGLARGRSLANAAVTALTAADGRYVLELPGVPRGINLRAEAADHATAEGWVVFGAQGPVPESLDFVLARNVLLEGRFVWDDDGTPLAGRRIVVAPVRAAHAGFTVPKPFADTATDADGRFRAVVSGGRLVRVELSSEEGDVVAKPIVAVPESGIVQEVFRLPRPAQVSITLNTLEVPLSEADAAPGDSAGAGPPSSTRAGQSSALAPPLQLMLAKHDLLVTRHTREEAPRRNVQAGVATFESVDAQVTWDVLVVPPGAAPIFLARGLRFPAGEHSRLTLDFDPRAVVPLPPATHGNPFEPTHTLEFRCRFTDETGRVLRADEFMRLVPFPASGRFEGTTRSLADGRRGVLRLDLLGSSSAEGRAQVFLSEPPVEVTLPLGAELVVRSPVTADSVVDIVVTAPREAGTLRLLATDGGGAPRIPWRALVTHRDTGATQIVLPLDGTGELTATLEPGPYLVSATVDGEESVPVSFELAPGETRTVTVAGGTPGMVQGRVEPPPEPGETAVVQAHPAEGGHPALTSVTGVNPDGSFTLTALPPGTWTLVCLISATGGAASGAASGAGYAAEHTPTRTLVTRGVQVPAGGVAHAFLRNDATATGTVTLRPGAGQVRSTMVVIEARDGPLRVNLLLLPGELRTLRLPLGRYTWRRFSESLDDQRSTDIGLPVPFDVNADPAAPALVIDA